ncbi:enoyl-CoA hydratase/isomerase family protein [bacterium]|nr:enoyl-CoA hydratase/isomerase family protein [bacterium]
MENLSKEKSSLIIKIKESQHVTSIILNDPDKLNAMGEAMAEQFSEAIQQVRQDQTCRVLVIKGSGKAFSAGGDLDMLQHKTTLTPQENQVGMLKFYRSFLALLQVEIPVVAAINGHAVGAGLCVAVACDMRIASTAAKLGFNFVRLGLHPGMGITHTLPNLIGPAHAAELLYTGRIISAAEAQRIGLVNHIVDAEKFDEAALGIANEIATAGPHAVRDLKHSLKQMASRTLNECLAREAEAQSKSYAGQEFKTGLAAIREKRDPQF